MRFGSFVAAGPSRVRFAKSRFPAALTATVIALVAGADATHAFQSNVTFCNHTKEPVELAFGYDAAGTAETTSRGWRKVAACACRELFSEETRATEFWYLVKKSGSDEILSGGRGPLCANLNDAFRYVNQNNSASSCRRAGGTWLNFAQGNTQGNANHKVTLGRQCNL